MSTFFLHNSEIYGFMVDPSWMALSPSNTITFNPSGVIGGTAVTATGGIAARTLSDRFADAINVRDFGAKLDGTSHPLSATFGTLAAAQAVYACALALTDETDWCAIQTAVNAGLTAIRIPGQAIINRPLVSSTVPITVIGDGIDVSAIIQTTAGQDGWQHTSTKHFQMFRISLKCSGIGGTALHLNFSGASWSYLTLRDVDIGGNGVQATNFWHDGIIANQPSVTTMDNVRIGGNQGASLSGIGNGIYMTPPLAPAADTGAFVVALYNCTINYYQNGIVLDSTGRTHNLQGVILDWVNCNQCMQFVRVLGTVLELVLNKCQYEGFGSAIYAEGAQGVVVRDCMFFVDPPSASAISAQLPQDVINAVGGGLWWIKDNSFIMQPSAVVGYFFNFNTAFNKAQLTDNDFWAQSATATGLISISNGSVNVRETGSTFSFWGAWPYCTNANSTGGTGNVISLGAVGTRTTLTANQWQQAGAYVGWNYASSGEMDLFSSKGAAGGGFNFYITTSSSVATPTLAASISSTAVTAPNGLKLGSNLGASNTDFAGGIDLYGGTYGIGITANRINYVAPGSSARHAFVVNGADAGVVTSTGINGTAIGITTPSTGKFTTLQATSALTLAAPATVTATTYTVLATDTMLILNPSAGQTLTLGTATAGRVLWLKLISAFAVISASSNVVPQASATAGTAILAATAGKFAMLVGDGTNWQIMNSN